MIKISECKAIKVSTEAAEGDNSTTIAALAQFVKFDPADAKRYDTSIPVVAFDALEDEYGAFEKSGGECDYYDGSWMTFKDGSTIKIVDVE